MANQEPTLDALVTELAQLRATLAAQQDIIARQQAAISTLQQATSTEPARFAHAAARAPQSDVEDDQTSASVVSDASEQRGGLTSRRGLLRGAAAATAAATVAGVALSASQPAHAAPLATGGNFILGQANDAGATTSLANTASTTPTTTLQVSNDVVNLANAAIYTTTAGANGVYALESNGGNGVLGVGLTSLGYGVYGRSDAGWGVVGDSGTGADIASIGTGMIYQGLQTNPGAPSGTFGGGESIRDSNGDLWLCVAAGSPGTWVKVAHLAPGLPGGAISYLSKPIRLFDSRSGATDALFHPGVRCAANSSTKVQVSGDVYNGVTVPASVAGAIGNVTVLNAAGAGFVELVPSGAGFTGAANLAFAPGQIISNAFNVGLNSTGALDVYVGSSAVDVIVDLFAIVA